MSKVDVRDGIYYLDEELSKLEFELFREFEDMLLERGYKYLSIPSACSWEVVERQAAVRTDQTLFIDERQALAGSAETGILDYFMDKEIKEEQRYFSFNECFRKEVNLDGAIRLREFKKIEQYIFCKPENAEKYFEEVLNNSLDFLKKHNIEYRVVDKTKEDPGYHIKKFDIEVKTKKYGWLETHSCTYFGDEQAKRVGFKGGLHTISNTGIASPRILIPFIERMYGDIL